MCTCIQTPLRPVIMALSYLSLVNNTHDRGRYNHGGRGGGRGYEDTGNNSEPHVTH